MLRRKSGRFEGKIPISSLSIVPDLRRKKTGMERSGPTLTASRLAGWPGGSGATTAAVWPSWCDTGGPPGLLRWESPKPEAQPDPCGPTARSTARWSGRQEDRLACSGFARRARASLPGLRFSSGLSGPLDTTTRPSLLCCTASAVIAQTQTFAHSIFHSQASRREARPRSVPTPSQTVDQAHHRLGRPCPPGLGRASRCL